MQLHGKAQVQIEFAKETFDVQVIVVESLTTEAILGRRFLVPNNCVVNVGKHLLHFENHGITVSLDSPPDGHVGTQTRTRSNRKCSVKRPHRRNGRHYNDAY